MLEAKKREVGSTDKVVHFEIPADDLPRAKAFYEKVFDWKIEKYPMPGMEYYGVHTVETDEKQMPKTAGAINGGMMQRSESASTPVIAVNVKNIEETLKKVTDGGGTLLMPVTKIADMGLYAYVKDTEGNVIGVWQDLQPAAPAKQ